MAYSTSNLPDDIIFAIAIQLRGDSHANLHAFVQVNKRWHQLGLPIFYGNIALTNATLERFTNSFNTQTHGKYVRSMTLRIERASGIHPTEYHGNPRFLDTGNPLFANARLEHKALSHTLSPERIANFIPLIPSFENLASFSLRLYEPAHWDSVPRATIVGLLKALPQSCTNLELDTGEPCSRFQSSGEERVELHVCEVLRGLLPRMQNVRVRLERMCGAMFGTGEATSDDFSPIALPKIKSLLVSCAVYGRQSEQCARPGHLHPLLGYTGGFAWFDVAAGLGKLVEKHGKSVKDARIYVTTVQRDDDLLTSIRADMIAGEPWAIPALTLWTPQTRFSGDMVLTPYLVRLPDTSELVAEDWEHVETIVEQRLWKDVLGGARLPADALDAERNGFSSFAAGCLETEKPTGNAEDWYPDPPTEEWHPNGRPARWRNEERTQTKIFQAERRTGDVFLRICPVENIIPEGWVIPRDSRDIQRLVPAQPRPAPTHPIPSTCRICNTSFPSKSKLHLHLKEAHPSPPSTN